LPLWLVGASIDMWIEVTRAGDSVADETPFLRIDVAVPAAIVLLVWRTLAHERLVSRH
jgi:hypothetical protein